MALALTCNACGLTVNGDEWTEHRTTDCVDSHDAKRRRARQAARNMRQARSEALDSQSFMRPGR